METRGTSSRKAAAPKKSAAAKTAAGVTLPPYKWVASNNFSGRAVGKPHLIVLHRPVGSFSSALQALTDDQRPPDERVSAHGLMGRPAGGRVEFYQLVAWDEKAWSCRSFNSDSYNLEIADEAWLLDPKARDVDVFNEAARLVAFLATKTLIPPRWTRDPLNVPGVIRHYDLGIPGGAHTDPTTDDALWLTFVRRVQFEYRRGGFRKVYGRGRLAKIA